jgi:hypothetical protein
MAYQLLFSIAEAAIAVQHSARGTTMLRRTLNDIACGLATHARKNLAAVERGAVPVRLVDDNTSGSHQFLMDNSVLGIFGNDNYIAEIRVRREVELVRRELRTLGVQEVGFGLSHDGYSWALLVNCDDRTFTTSAGKALHRELLKITLEEIVGRAWQAVSDASGISRKE